QNVDSFCALRQFVPAIRALCGWKPVEKDILTLEHAYDRRLEFGFKSIRHANQKRAGKAKHIRSGLNLEPLDQLLQFTRLVSLFASEHRKREFAQIPGTGVSCPRTCPFQEFAGSEELAHPARSASEQSRFLVEINVDAAEKNGRAGALVGLVQS